MGACPADITTCNPLVTYATPSATGTPAAPVTCSPASGTNFTIGTTVVTCTAANSCGTSSCSFNVIVQSSSSAAANISSNAANNEICLGSNITLTVNGGSLGIGANWVWYEGSCGTTGSIGTGTTLTITPSTAGTHTYYVRAEGTCNTTTCVSLAVSVKTIPPSGTVHIVSAPTDGCVGGSGTVSVNAVATATFYRWSCSSGGVLFNGQPGPYDSSVPSVNITYTALPSGGGSGWSICVFPGNACGNSNTICAWVRAVVGRPTQINGSVIGCANTTSTYSCAASAGASSYIWNVTGNATITAGNGTQNVTVSFGSGFTSGSLCVHAQTSCGYNSADICLSLNGVTAVPGKISGPGNVCPNASSSFSVAAVPGATSYIWTTTVPGATVTNNGTSCSILFPSAIPGGSTVCVQSLGACGTPSAQRCKGIATGLPGVPASISGPAGGQCGATGVSYTINPVSGATGYLWSANNGAVINGPNNLSGVTIDFPSTFTGVTLSVNALNACGMSGARTLGVLAVPAIPGAITGSNSTCNGMVEFYSTTGSAGATGYTWTVPAGATILGGQNSASIVVLWGATGGNVTVKATNGCGNSGLRTLAVSVPCRLNQVSGSSNGIAPEVYPNPATGKVNIKFYNTDDETLLMQVSDLTGRILLTQHRSAHAGLNVHEFDLSSFAKGIYLVHLNGKDMNSVIRLTIE